MDDPQSSFWAQIGQIAKVSLKKDAGGVIVW